MSRILLFVLVYGSLQSALAARYERVEGYTHRNGDCNGNDIRKIERTSVGNCADQCNEDERCKTFLFNDRGRRSYCWLKHSECQRLTYTATRNYHFYNKIVRTTPLPTTPGDATPGPLQDFQVRLVPRTRPQKLNITWRPPRNWQAVRSYTLKWQKVGEDIERTKRIMFPEPIPMWIRLDGYPGSDYQVKLAAVGRGGRMGEYSTKMVHIPEKRPSGAPTNVTFTVTHTTINVTWQPPELRYRNGKIVEYRLEYWDGSLARSFDTRNRTYRVIGEGQPLVPGKTYRIAVRASTRAGSGPWTRPRYNVTTVPTTTTTTTTTTPAPRRTTPKPRNCWYNRDVGDCPGHDIYHAKLDLKACEAACWERTDCISFQLFNGTDCWLKNFICSRGVLTRVGDQRYQQYTKWCHPVSQVCNYTLETADCLGRDIMNDKLELGACREACTVMADCKSFQLHKGNECWLKNYACSRRELSHVGDTNYQQWTRKDCVPYTQRPGALAGFYTWHEPGNPWTIGVMWRPPYNRESVHYYLIIIWCTKDECEVTDTRIWPSEETLKKYKIRNALPGVTYRIGVAAVGRTGSIGKWSEVMYKLPDTTPPPPAPNTTTRAPTTQRPVIDYNNLAGYTHRTGDCPGNDIRKIEDTSVYNCARNCNESRRCKTFIYNARGDYCWLKYSECPSLGYKSTWNYHFYNKIVSRPPITPPPPTRPGTSRTKAQNVQVEIVFPDPIVALVSWDAPQRSPSNLVYHVSYGKKGSPATDSWLVQGLRVFYAPYLEGGETYEFNVTTNFVGKAGETASVSLVMPIKAKEDANGKASFNCNAPQWVILGQSNVGAYPGTSLVETNGVTAASSAWKFENGYMRFSQSQPVVPNDTSFTFGAFVKDEHNSTATLLAAVLPNGGSPAPYPAVVGNKFGYKPHREGLFYTVPTRLGRDWRFVGYSVNVENKTWLGFVDDKIEVPNTYGYSGPMRTHTAGDLLVGMYDLRINTRKMSLTVAGMTIRRGAIDRSQVKAFKECLIASALATP